RRHHAGHQLRAAEQRRRSPRAAARLDAVDGGGGAERAVPAAVVRGVQLAGEVSMRAEGWAFLRAERRAAPKPARIPSGDRPTYSSAEGLSFTRAERRAAPKPARIPSGDRAMYASIEGLQ